MSKKNQMNRLGATAIAAVLALHSTPVLAQVADPLAATAPEATIAPAAEPVAAEPAPVATTTTAEPVADTTVAADPAPAPAARSSNGRETAPRPARSVTRRASSSAPTSSSTTGASAEASTPAPVMDSPAPTPPVPAVATEPVPAEAEPGLNDNLPLMAGGAGAAALALLGTGLLASRRRRRRDEMVADHAEPQVVAPAIYAPTAEPTMERSAFAWGNAAPASPAATAAQAQKLPHGFDVSRYGRHVQAAYRGPTPDNPSLSLKKRIKRASFFDLRERQAAARSRGNVGINPALVPA